MSGRISMGQNHKALPQVYNTDFLSTALAKMKEHEVRHLPVYDQNHYLVGSISKSDVYAFKNLNMTLNNMCVSDFMSKNLAYVQASANLREVLHTIITRDLSCVLVKQYGQLIGIVSAAWYTVAYA
jgi:acetoin utilization protein AcuB